MSEERTTNSSAPNKPAGSRKRASKVKAGKGQAEVTLPTPETPSPSGEAIAIRLSAIDREAMIQTAAYFRAERRNFAAGRELEDWLAAESEIDAALLSGSLPSG